MSLYAKMQRSFAGVVENTTFGVSPKGLEENKKLGLAIYGFQVTSGMVEERKFICTETNARRKITRSVCTR